MKKTYISPEMSTMNMGMESMIATSIHIANDITVNQGSELNREEEDLGGAWDTEW